MADEEETAFRLDQHRPNALLEAGDDLRRLNFAELSSKNGECLRRVVEFVEKRSAGVQTCGHAGQRLCVDDLHAGGNTRRRGGAMADRTSAKTLTASELIVQKLKETFDRKGAYQEEGPNVWVIAAAAKPLQEGEGLSWEPGSRRPTHRVRVVLRTSGRTGLLP